MRGVLSGMIVSFGTIGALIFSIALGMDQSSWTVFWVTLLIGCVVVVFAAVKVHSVGRVNMQGWLDEHAACAYTYAYDGCGIAVDDRASQIHLTARMEGKMVSKSYGFDAVREWGFEIPQAQQVEAREVFGGGVRGGMYNTQQAMEAAMVNSVKLGQARETTGLWLHLRDIDYPRWFIKFETNNRTATTLRRWMEILAQTINEGRPTRDRAS